MNTLFVFCLVALFALSVAETSLHPRGCVYALGKCIRDCEEGTHAYTTGCGRKTPEATCDEPDPRPESGVICDYSACYCDPPTVRHTASNKCMPLDKCPK